MRINSHVIAILPFGCLIFYPLSVLIVIGGLIIPEFRVYIKEICDVFLSTLLLFTPILFIRQDKCRRRSALLVTYILALLVLLKLSFYHLYGVKINASAFFVIFETHSSEASDFLINYIDWKVIFLMVLLILPIKLIYSYLKKLMGFDFRLRGMSQFVFTILVLGASIYCLIWKFQKENLAISAISSYRDYKEFKSNMKSELSKPVNHTIEVTSFSEAPQTNIVVIGESTSRWHMQLYGYNRETNPLLNKIKDELLVFEDVVTPHVHTLVALEKILTLSNYSHPQKEENISIVQLANQAGFETYWLSNQKPIGLHESVATTIGNAAKHTYFINSEDTEDIIYDETILPLLDSILSQNPIKKLIFIHLIGTHIKYDKRYPKSFDYFNDSNSTAKTTNKNHQSIIDSYDNAIRYNDYIVNAIIEKARKIESMGYVAYFSDHGDEVFDTMDFMGHNEYYGTRPMYEVPFIVWLSEGYKKSHNNADIYKTVTRGPYNLEDFIHSFSDLTDIKFDGFDARKSIVHPNYVKRERVIK